MTFGFNEYKYRFIAKLLCVGCFLHIGGHVVSLGWDRNTFFKDTVLKGQNV